MKEIKLGMNDIKLKYYLGHLLIDDRDNIEDDWD